MRQLQLPNESSGQTTEEQNRRHHPQQQQQQQQQQRQRQRLRRQQQQQLQRQQQKQQQQQQQAAERAAVLEVLMQMQPMGTVLPRQKQAHLREELQSMRTLVARCWAVKKKPAGSCSVCSHSTTREAPCSCRADNASSQLECRLYCRPRITSSDILHHSRQ